MKKALGTVLVVLALACAVVGIAITAGLFPAMQPETAAPVPLVPQQPLVTPPAVVPVTKARVPEASAFILCGAPAQGASLTLSPTNGETNRFFTWCDDGYLLLDVDVRAEAPLVNKLVHLPSRLSRPGGALLTDVTADGTSDLVVAVSPDLGVVHAPGSAVFLAKGRQAGGFEAALPLLEMPVVGLSTVQLEAAPKPPELFALTRGDAAARRTGDLVWFRPGPTPLKHRTFPAGLAPRDLRAWQSAPGAPTELLVVATDPGRVLAFNPSAPDAPSNEAPLVDGQQLCAGSKPVDALARGTHDLMRVAGQPVFGLLPWFAQANVGRCQAGDLDDDGELDVLAVTDAGFIWLRKPGDDGASELVLPEGYRALDVAALPSSPKRVVGLALDVTGKQLVLLIWSALPWSEDLSLSIPNAPQVLTAPAVEIPLE